MTIRRKRAYEPVGPRDGHRVLVERLWPRGVSREDLALDAWARRLAPSTALRRWFAHDPARWDEFRRRYRAELAEHADELAALRRRARRGRVTLVYGSREERYNAAAALQEILEEV